MINKFYLLKNEKLMATVCAFHFAEYAAKEMSIIEPGNVFSVIARSPKLGQDDYYAYQNGKQI